MDYWEHLEWEAVDDWAALAARLPQRAYGCSRKRAARFYTDARFEPGDGLVFGSESRGLPASLLAQAPDRCLRIAMRAEARSLNLAVSVAVAAFEALRQFQTPG